MSKFKFATKNEVKRGLPWEQYNDYNSHVYNQVRVGSKTLSDGVTVNKIDPTQRFSARMFTRERVMLAIERQDLKLLRQMSKYFYMKSGIYERLCNYMASMFLYDWFITPQIYDQKLIATEAGKKKIMEGWWKASQFLDNCRLKQIFTDIALKVVRDGCYYGYMLVNGNKAVIQELPVNYCRSQYAVNGLFAIEFNVSWFDEMFPDINQKKKVLKMFPKDIQQAYIKYKHGTLPKDVDSDTEGWVLLDPAFAVKFNLHGNDVPMFCDVMPHLMDLEEAQAIDKQKMLQQILKILIQQFPLDKNYQLVFDVDEMNAFHNMAVNMIGDAIGVDVLSTLADVQVADMSDKGNVSAVDQLEKVERTVYNAAGVSQNQFNSTGNIALEKSISNDESVLLDLIYQFENFSQRLLDAFNKNPRRLYYKVQILPTTIYNYQNLSKIYKEQTMLGFSKLLPQVALGISQSSVISTAILENQILHLDELFIPPQMSSTMSSNTNSGNSSNEPRDTNDDGDSAVGRPALDPDERSDKTNQNIESMS